jgi:hypothetical protein
VTGPVPPADPDTLRRAALWCTRLADGLADLARRVGMLSEQIAQDWPDDRGRELAERSALLHRALGREAVAAAELGEAYARELLDPGLPPAVAAAAGPARRQGMRLGGTDAARTDDGRGMRIAALPEPGGPAS